MANTIHNSAYHIIMEIPCPRCCYNEYILYAKDGKHNKCIECRIYSNFKPKKKDSKF